MGGGSETAQRQMNRLWRVWRTVHEMCRDRVRHFFYIKLSELNNADFGCFRVMRFQTPKFN